MSRFIKDPQQTIDVSYDWTAWLGAGETIQTVLWTLPAGITKVSESQAGAVCTIRLSGGTATQRYLVTLRITTTPAARQADRSFNVICVER